MIDHGLKGRELAKRTGLLPSLISRIKTGEQKFIAKDDLAKITACFTNLVGSQTGSERFLIDFATMLGMYPKTRKE
jgi:hypothetical protein